MDKYFFTGGGFKTFFYFGFMRKIIKINKMPYQYAGSSSGTISAAICAALSTTAPTKRSELLEYANNKMQEDLLEKTRPFYMNWLKCSISAKVTREICETIQPDITKISNQGLSMLITHYKFPFTFSRHIATSWKNWDDFEKDIRCGSSIPFIQDYWLNVDSTNTFALDGDILPYNLPSSYKHITCMPCNDAYCCPSEKSYPKWYHIIWNPSKEDINSWIERRMN